MAKIMTLIRALFSFHLLAACHAENARNRAAHFGVGPELCGCATPCNVTWTDYRYNTNEERLAQHIGNSERCNEHRYTGADDEDGFEGSRIAGAGADGAVTFTVGTPCQDLVNALLGATMDCGGEGTCHLKDAVVTPVTCMAGATVDIEPIDPMIKFVDAMFALGVILAVPSAVFSVVGWSYCCRSSCCPPALSQRWSQRTVMGLNLALGSVVFCCLLTSWIVDSKLRCQGGSHGGCGEDVIGEQGIYYDNIFGTGAYVSGIACFIAIVSVSTGFALCGPPVAILASARSPSVQMTQMPVMPTGSMVQGGMQQPVTMGGQMPMVGMPMAAMPMQGGVPMQQMPMQGGVPMQQMAYGNVPMAQGQQYMDAAPPSYDAPTYN